MHFDSSPPTTPAPSDDKRPWYKLLNRYHWFVLVVAVLGWSFDTMDQQLFNLARRPAMTELLAPESSAPAEGTAESAAPAKASEEDIAWFGTIATSIFLIGWATGGLIFGILGDKIGRAKTMMLTILLYSLFTGLSALSTGVWDFALYRFLTGLGVGGEFAVGVALVAEAIPERARTPALGWVQAFSAVGNITAAMITSGLGFLQRGSPTVFGLTSWRVMFLVGAVPALLAVVVRAGLREPDRWKAAARKADVDPEHPVRDLVDGEGPEPVQETAAPAAALSEPAGTDNPYTAPTADTTAPAPTPATPSYRLGSLAEMFGDPTLRRNTIVGMLLAFSGVVGLWGIGFFSFDLFRIAFRQILERQGLSGKALEGQLTIYVGYISFFQNFGAFLGVYSFARVTQIIGRKPAFAISFVIAMLSTAFTFWYVGRIGGLYTAYLMVFVMGFCQISLFGGYAIYFPELFPTRLRSTGTSFCYNVGRLVAAVGPLFLGYLSSVVFAGMKQHGPDWPMRYACVSMCLIFLVGLCALPFAPETMDQPLPE